MSDARPSQADGATRTCATDLEILERYALAGLDLLQTLLRSLERTGNPVEDIHDAGRVRIGLVECSAQERAGERAFLHPGPLCETLELLARLR